MAPSTGIIVKTEKVTPRLSYVAGFMESVFRVPVKINASPDFAEKHIIINYSTIPVKEYFNIYSVGLMNEETIRPITPDFERVFDKGFIFPAPSGYDMPFDVFSAIFFMISRYEEYLDFNPDIHGRFEATESFAFKHGFHEDPVVDEWLIALSQALSFRFPSVSLNMEKFRFVSTFDVDHPWELKHKGLIRNAAGIFKSVLKLNFAETARRFSVYTGKSPDPFDTYDYIKEIEEKHHFSSVFFFLFGNYGKHDKNFAVRSLHFKELVNNLRNNRIIGFHPSYRSNCNARLLDSESRKYQEITRVKPQISRQHYLLLRFPGTYRKLISAGITDDYSMGYSSEIGFRAGTTLPFRFYDLKEDKETELTIHPFAFMDVTLRQYLHLNSDEASEKIRSLIAKVRNVNGIFISLWHNESLSETGDWKGWRKVFEQMISDAMAPL